MDIGVCGLGFRRRCKEDIGLWCRGLLRLSMRRVGRLPWIILEMRLRSGSVSDATADSWLVQSMELHVDVDHAFRFLR